MEEIVVKSRSGTTERLFLGDVVGEGGTAVVRECRLGQQKLVAKIFKEPMARDLPSTASVEQGMLQSCASPFVVRPCGLYSVKQSVLKGHFAMVSKKKSKLPEHPDPKLCMMLMEQHDCSVHELTCFSFMEEEVAFVCHGLLRALQHLHSLRIIHRDVKPGNISVADGGERVLLSDFGLAAFLPSDSNSFVGSKLGTTGFMAPESLLTGKYSPASDMFAVGTVAYQLLFGTHAFIRDTPSNTVRATVMGHLPLEPCGKPVGKSSESCAFIKQLLRDEKRRPSALQALQSPWLEDLGTLETLLDLRRVATTLEPDEVDDFLEKTTMMRNASRATPEKVRRQKKASWGARVFATLRKALPRGRKVAPAPNFSHISPN